MFKNLANFGFKRNLMEVIGFFIAYNLIFTLCSMLISGLFAIITGVSPEESRKAGVKMGTVVSVIAPLTLSLLILHRKKLLSHFGYFLLVFIGPAIALFGGGGILAMIPTSFLTMLPIKTNSPSPLAGEVGMGGDYETDRSSTFILPHPRGGSRITPYEPFVFQCKTRG